MGLVGVRRMGEAMENNSKLKEVLLYIASKDTSLTSSVKLNKILFFSDVEHLFRYGKTITGLTYRKQSFGPTPKGLVGVLKELENEGSAENTVKYGPSWTQRRYTRGLRPLRAVKDNVIPDIEKGTLDATIEWIKPLSSEEISAESHDFLGYKLAEENKEIHLGTVFVDSTPLSQEEMDYAKTLTPTIG